MDELRHKALRMAQHRLSSELRGGALDRQVEAVPAGEAEVVGEDVAIQLVAESSAQQAAASPAYQSAQNCSREGAQRNTNRTGNSSKRGASLAAH